MLPSYPSHASVFTAGLLVEPNNRFSSIPAASFQQAVIEVLVKRALQAARQTGAPLVTLSGGVSCNEALRTALGEACGAAGLEFRPCPPAFSTDNAAMIAFTAWHHLRQGRTSSLREDIDPNLALA